MVTQSTLLRRFNGISAQSATKTANAGERETLDTRRREAIPWIASPLKYADGENLHFYRHEDATTIELFFDLFFVANLTTFTIVHEINDHKSLLSYIGFFAIIWGTWLQVALFDVRFALDSIFERVCKVIQLATMVGFASVGSQFAPEVIDQNFRAFQTMSILLLINRGLLAIQYSTVAVLISKKHKGVVRPLAFIIVILAITAGVYLGLIFGFALGGHPDIYYIWYIALVIEAIAVVGVSMRWRLLSFKHTHLTKRMGLLTLIILGEGIIGVTRTVNKVVLESTWNGQAFLQILVIAMTIYFLWQLYFDHHPPTHYGTQLQQIWTLLHFPFHVALILLLEGIQQFARILNVYNQITTLLLSLNENCLLKNLNGAPLSLALNTTIQTFHLNAGSKIHSRASMMQEEAELAGGGGGIGGGVGGGGGNGIAHALEAVQNSTTYCATNTSEFNDPIEELFSQVIIALFKRNDIDPPANTDPSDVDSFTRVFKLVYIYFFVSAGVVLLSLGLFLWIVRRRRRRRGRDIYDAVAIGMRVVVGISLLGLAAVASNEELTNMYMQSAWVIGTVLVALVLVVLTDFILDFIAVRNVSRRYSTAVEQLQLNRVRAHSSDPQPAPKTDDARYGHISVRNHGTGKRSPSAPPGVAGIFEQVMQYRRH
ncbi:MAG: hypothetical protein M1835_006039 [Candelina submexicana]|nr:MAG: hypothetical protein M1835_006039 [Candelina submexicana]